MYAYFVSGTWKNNDGVITDLYVHLVESHVGNTYYFAQGQRKSVTAIMNDINANNNAYWVLIWNYATAEWIRGRKVTIVKAAVPYLRSSADRTERDNLDNLINMLHIIP